MLTYLRRALKISLTDINKNIDKENVTIQDDNDVIYTFNIKKNDIDIGDKIVIKYIGVIDKENHET